LPIGLALVFPTVSRALFLQPRLTDVGFSTLGSVVSWVLLSSRSYLDMLLLALSGVVWVAGIIVLLVLAPPKSAAAVGRIRTTIAALVASGAVLLIVLFLLRARTLANEDAAIGDLRTIISAETTYAALANGNYYDTLLACVARPQSCCPGYANQMRSIPEWDADTPGFISAELAAKPVRYGYKRELHPGVAAPFNTQISESSVVGFALVLVPVTPGLTGNRAFCGDESGMVRFAADGRMPPIVDGKCPESLGVLTDR
jgi:hypothetical protein